MVCKLNGKGVRFFDRFDCFDYFVAINLQVGGRPVYEQLLKLYREANLQEEKDRIMRSLG